MNTRPEPLALYVQASASMGLGHLTRSLAVSRALTAMGFEVRFMLAADSYGREKAEAMGIRSETLSTFTSVIIDAASIPEEDARFLRQFRHRILISPVCDRADLATQVLVRAVSEKLRSSLDQNARVTEDPSFALTTTKRLEPRKLTFERIRLGICLSGGRDALNMGEFVDRMVRIPSVSTIHVLHHEALEVSPEWSTEIHQARYHEDPWSYFSDINVFIGGDGLLISEAIAQGIPTLSLTTEDHYFKNQHLNDSGHLKCFFREALDYWSLQQLLANRHSLEEMHRTAREHPLPDGARLLAQSIAHGITD
ncbi:MAG: hypothetical protein R3296_15040 [Oleiphilaceae bacterium]|nr:hypothetical protein [Oleiphilaceae bacterium]